MKIVFLHMTIGLANRGSEVSVNLIANELAGKHTVQLFSSSKINNSKYKHITVPTINKPPASAPISALDKLKFRLHLDASSIAVTEFTMACLPRIISFNPDIIIATNGATQLKLLKENFSKTKVVVFGHAGIGHDDRSNLAQQPSLFIALSHQAKKWALSLAAPKTKVVYIPNPVDLSQYKQVSPASVNLPKPIVISVSALTKYKNLSHVIRATAATKASLLIVGLGENEQELKLLANKLLPNRHLFMHTDPASLPSLYKSANIFCLTPDPQEAFGRVFIEAMAAGLPIVTSNDPIRRSIIGPAGVFVDHHQISSITKGINKALKITNPDYADLLVQYDLTTVIKQIEHEFKKL